MAENTTLDTIHDDDLADEALDRSDRGKQCASAPGMGCSSPLQAK